MRHGITEDSVDEQKMSDQKLDLATEKFFYYCMGLRKGDMRKQVEMMRGRYPNDTAVIPVAGPAFRFLGMASGTTMMMILNMTLVMQIALIFGYDLDDRARVKELAAVIAATAAATSCTAVVPQLASLRPRLGRSRAGRQS